MVSAPTAHCLLWNTGKWIINICYILWKFISLVFDDILLSMHPPPIQYLLSTNYMLGTVLTLKYIESETWPLLLRSLGFSEDSWHSLDVVCLAGKAQNLSRVDS